MSYLIKNFNGDKKNYLYDRFLCQIGILLFNMLNLSYQKFHFLFKIARFSRIIFKISQIQAFWPKLSNSRFFATLKIEFFL